MPRPTKESKIYKVFCETEQLMTTGEVAEEANVTRATAKKWIDRLVEQGKVKQTRKVGNIALYERASREEAKASQRLTSNDTQQTH